MSCVTQWQSRAVSVQCEPVALQPAVTATALKRGSRGDNQTKLLELLEFMTHVSSDASVPTVLRVLRDMCKHVEQLNNEFGRRAKSILLPASWADSGVFSIAKSGASQIALPHKLLDAPPCVDQDQV